MSRPVPAVYDQDERATRIAGSAILHGDAHVGDQALIAEGAVIRSVEGAVTIGTGSAVLENSVVVGTPTMPTTVGRRSTFGHRCLVIGAQVGDLCEIGNASILMPGSTIGDRVFLGEGTLVPAGTSLPSDVVAVGRPARVIRSVATSDLDRLRGLRAGDLTIPDHTANTMHTEMEALPMAQLHTYRGTLPSVAASAILYRTAEITGDVVIGQRTIIGAGVKIVGDSHGPVRIGNDVQILENTVLHLLPDNELVIEDGATIGPGCMIHGARIGRGTVVEPGAIVCDGSTIGPESIVAAGAVVKQRVEFDGGMLIDGFPAEAICPVDPPGRPGWALTGSEAQ